MHSQKPSATALLIAKSQLLLAADPAHAVEVGAARAAYYRGFVEAVTGRPWRLNRLTRCTLKWMERVSVPGIYLHYARRKRRIEQMARDFLANARNGQVVVIAAGFDPLAAMLSREYPDAAFFELDHPATQRCKKAALEKLRRGNNPALVPMDITKQSVGHALAGTPFSPGKRTLFIAEGITMYLNEEEVKRLFLQIHSSAQHGESRFLFTYMNKQPSGAIQFENATKLVDIWLRLKKERFKWGIGTGELNGFLASTGWCAVDATDAGNGDATPPRGENICLAAMKSLGDE
jgi:methyltransferase (TIGR00027 family)